MKIKTEMNNKYITKDAGNQAKGFLLPIYNVPDSFFPAGNELQRVCLTVMANTIKGPYLHFVRTGRFTCIKGSTRLVLKFPDDCQVARSGDDHKHQPVSVLAALESLGEGNAYVLNTPNPTWTMNDGHTADFIDFYFGVKQ